MKENNLQVVAAIRKDDYHIGFTSSDIKLQEVNTAFTQLPSMFLQGILSPGIRVSVVKIQQPAAADNNQTKE
jgi:hypothetical protein